MWSLQQTVLLLALSGHSLSEISRNYPLARHTIRRWKAWLEREFLRHADAIKKHFTELGVYQTCASFWCACFESMSLADAMLLAYAGKEAVP